MVMSCWPAFDVFDVLDDFTVLDVCPEAAGKHASALEIYEGRLSGAQPSDGPLAAEKGHRGSSGGGSGETCEPRF